jgi:hypothetical protein
MLGESDRRDDLGADEGLGLTDELDPLDADTYCDTYDDTGDVDDSDDSDADADTAVAPRPADGDEWDPADPDLPDESGGGVDGGDEMDEIGSDQSGDGSDTDLDADTTAAEVPYAPLDATPEAPTPPVTGDETVDDAMLSLAESQAGSFAERIDAGEHAHRSLQSRLGGLGGA